MENLIFNSIQTKKYNDGYLSFLRFTDKQLEFYALSGEYYREMSLTSAGVYIAFSTNGSEITFEYKILKSEFKDIYFDLYVNDAYQYSLECEKQFGKLNFKVLSFNGIIKNIKIYFPYITAVAIRNLKVNGDINYVKKHKNTMLCFGDSITQGFMAQKPSFAYATQLARHMGMNLINQGIGGFGYKEGILTGLEQLEKPDIITVAYGTNNWYFDEDIEGFKEQVGEFFKRLHYLYEKTPVFVITPIWRRDIESITKMGSFFDIINIIVNNAKVYDNITVIDGLKCFPHNEVFLKDGRVHPNDEGFLYYTNSLLNYLNNFYLY